MSCKKLWLTRSKGHVRASLVEVCPYLVRLYLGIVDVDKSPFLLEVADKRNGSRLAGVTRVSLESKAKNSNAL